MFILVVPSRTQTRLVNINIIELQAVSYNISDLIIMAPKRYIEIKENQHFLASIYYSAVR